MMTDLTLMAGGAWGLVNYLRDSWITPFFILGIIGFAAWFGVRSKFRQMGVLFVAAAFAAAIIYGAPAMFGKNGSITKQAQNVTNAAASAN